MPKANTNSKKGFTIIEVVLVLAIAGLIFLMVFIAFPALQRSQHDTQRTDDMARVQAKLIDWQNNHSNNLPKNSTFNSKLAVINQDTGELDCTKNAGDACEFVRDYMNAAASNTSTGGKSLNSFKDPSGEYYNIVITGNIAGNGDIDSKLVTKSFTNDDYEATEKIEVSGDEISLTGPIDGYVMFIIPGATCEEDHAKRSTKNNFAVLYRMEGAGVKCTNNGS